MEVAQFYLHPPSTASLDKFPNNTLTEYRVCLPLPWSQRLSFILYWQILRRELLLLFFLLARSAESREKKALCSRPLGTSLSCHQLLTVVSDWRKFLIALRVIWLDGLNIFGDSSGVSMLTFMGRCRVLLLYQRIFSPGKGKIFVVVSAYKHCKFRRSW